MTTITNSSSLNSTIYNVLDPKWRETNLDWQPYTSDGRKSVEIVRLYEDRPNGKGPAAALLKYAPGAKVPTHLHQGYELILVIDGELINDAGRHKAGTLEICPPGSTHGLSTETGCIFLVVWEQPVSRLN